MLDANVEFIKLLELGQIDGVAYIRRMIENVDLVHVPPPPTNTPRPTWGIAPRPTATIAPTAPPPTHPIVLEPSPTPVPDPFSYVLITIHHLPEDEESISSLIEFLADNGSTDIERSEPFVTSAQVTFRMVRRLARHPEYESTFIFGLYSDKMEVAIDWPLTKYVAGIITAAEAAEESRASRRIAISPTIFQICRSISTRLREGTLFATSSWKLGKVISTKSNP